VHADHLGTPLQVLDQANQLRWRWDPAPFGETAAEENPSGLGVFELNLRFPGQYFDKETNLHYNYQRDYDSATGRYIQSDPIGLRGGINTYAYVRNHPLKRSDPRGLIEWTGSGTGGAFLTAALFTFNLTSECVNGKQGTATVVLAGPGLGLLGVDLSFTSSDVKLKDSLSDVDPMVFNDPSLSGGFIATAGLSFGASPAVEAGRTIAGAPPNSPTGFGCAAVRLGNAGGAGCGEIRGFELGVGVFVGSSTVISSRIQTCGCNAK